MKPLKLQDGTEVSELHHASDLVHLEEAWPLIRAAFARIEELEAENERLHEQIGWHERHGP